MNSSTEMLVIKRRRDVAVISKTKFYSTFLDTHNVEIITHGYIYVHLHYGLVRGLALNDEALNINLMSIHSFTSQPFTIYRKYDDV